MKRVISFLLFITTAYAQEEAPTFFLPTLDGENFFASELYGEKAKNPKVTFISFSASWCAPCQKEIRALDSLSVKFPEVGFYLIDYKEKKDVVIKWKDRLKTEIPILLDVYGLVAKKFGVTSAVQNGGAFSVNLPTSFVMNEKGEIIYSHIGYEDKDAKVLEGILQQQR
ncbi:MAG: TlpA disulfide reductase family protein [Candidatus Marinimicrobia bacterium]|jgi:peroxiredoxin|nr:TlpA disulfide reductase family protein [Candidatus Neomarinimicrobiota bacterium]